MRRFGPPSLVPQNTTFKISSFENKIIGNGKWAYHFELDIIGELSLFFFKWIHFIYFPLSQVKHFAGTQHILL